LIRANGWKLRGWMRQLLVIALLLGGVSSAHAEEIRVLTAGSLKGALGAIAAQFEQSHTAHITLIGGPAGALRDRIIGGEAFDVYATAAFPQAQSLTDKGLARASVLIARNRLCVLVRSESAITPDTLIDALLRPDAKPGTSTPNFDPAGDYTWEFFRRLDREHPGAYEALTARAQMLFGGADRKTAERGSDKGGDPLGLALDDKSVDLVFLYCSGAMSKAEQSSGKYRAFALPEPYAITAEYGLTLSPLASSLAADFFLAVLSPSGQETLRRFGFIPVTAPGSTH
jgi:molybdate transport system substrate-binding protein